jgi:hypothetical protein
MATTLGQRCTVYLDEKGVQRFKIDNSIDSVLAGDLPVYGPSPFTSNIFVHKIIDPLDPKGDTFLRVGNVADLTTFPLGREIAVGLNQSLYLSTEFTVVYDDIATASAAKVLIQQRVDNLIADWHTYNDQFLAPLTVPPDYSVIPMPLNSSIVSERTDAYNTAHAELLQSKVDVATANSEANITAAAAAAANQASIDALENSSQCSVLLGHFVGGYDEMLAYRAAVNIFRTAAITYDNATVAFVAAADVYRSIVGTPSGGDKATYDAAKALYAAAKLVYDATVVTMNTAATNEIFKGEATLNSFRSEMSAACSQKIQGVSIAAQKKKDADKTAAVAATAKSAADEVTSAALLADTETFLSLKEVCPTAERTVP